MGLMQRVVRPRNKKIKRALEGREPKAIENDKTSIFVKGLKCSETARACMKDFHSLRRPNSINLISQTKSLNVKPKEIPESISCFESFQFNQKNDIRPFEDANKLEFFCKKFDASLFAFGNHTKKRPDNLIIGRLYDQHILDMAELHIQKFRGLNEFDSDKVPVGTKPCLIFSGPIFESDAEMKRVKSLMIDFFRGPVITHIRREGLEHVIQFTGFEKEGQKFVLLRSYRTTLQISEKGRFLGVDLEEMGPRVDFQLRRLHLASDDHFAEACKQVKNVHKKKKVKNISEDGLGSTLGRIHIPAQRIGTLQTRKIKGLKETEMEKKLKNMEQMKEKRAKAEESRKAKVEKIFANED